MDTSALEAATRAAGEALAKTQAEHATALAQAEQDKNKAEAKAAEAAKAASEAQQIVQAALADNQAKDRTIADLQSQIAALKNATADTKSKTRG